MKRYFLLIIAFIAFVGEAQKWRSLDAEFDSIASLCEYSRNDLTVPSQYGRWIISMRALAQKHGSKPMQWRTDYWESWFLGRLNRKAEEKELLERCLAAVDTVNFTYDYHRILLNSHLNGNWNNFALSYRFIRQELEYYKVIDDNLMIGLMYINLARIFDEAQMYGKAMEYDKKAEQYYRKIGFNGAIIHGNVDEIYRLHRLKMDDRATELYEEMNASPYFIQDTVARYALLTAGNYIRIDSGAATKAYRLAIAYKKNPLMIYGSMINMGMACMSKGDFPGAIAFFRQSLELSRSNDPNNTAIQLPAYSGLHKCYESIQRYDSAYLCLNRYQQITDSIRNINSQDQFMADIEVQLLKQEEEKFDLERNESRMRNAAIISLLVLALVVALMLAWRHRIQRRAKEVENERLAAIAEKESMEREIYRRQCEDHERELTTNTLLLIEKKNMIENLTREIKDGGQGGKIDGEVKRKLLNLIKLHDGSEESLKQFYDYFNKVHPDFSKSLKEKFPSLTKGELRLSAYIRIGLDNKQIAQIANVQADGIKKARYRMRKKLGLATADSLDDFLMLWGSKSHTTPENQED